MNISEEKGKVRVPIKLSYTHDEISYEENKKALDDLMKEINLRYIVQREFMFDGKKELHNSNFTDFASLVSPYKEEILENIIGVSDLIRPAIPVEEFMKEKNITSINGYLNTAWWLYIKDGMIYKLCDDVIVDPNRHIYYKFFLPFVLRHCKPINVGDVLYYHRDKYYKDSPQPFYSLLQRFLKEKKGDFWYQENTESEIIDWLAQNGNKEEKTSRVTNGFTLIKSRNEFKNEDNMDNIMKVFDQLKYDGFLSRKTKLPQFRRIFKNVDQIENYAILNWEQSIGSLHFFIDELEQNAKIEKQQGKWIKCAQMFNVQDEQINPKSIAHNNKLSKKLSKMISDIIAILD